MMLSAPALCVLYTVRCTCVLYVLQDVIGIRFVVVVVVVVTLRPSPPVVVDAYAEGNIIANVREQFDMPNSTPWSRVRALRRGDRG